jgi:hypothetical protein
LFGVESRKGSGVVLLFVSLSQTHAGRRCSSLKRPRVFRFLDVRDDNGVAVEFVLAVARARRERFANQSLVGRGVRSVGRARPPGPSGSCGDFAGIVQPKFRRKEEDATSSLARWVKRGGRPSRRFLSISDVNGLSGVAIDVEGEKERERQHDKCRRAVK